MIKVHHGLKFNVKINKNMDNVKVKSKSIICRKKKNRGNIGKKDTGSNIIISHSKESMTLAFKKSLDASLSLPSYIIKIKDNLSIKGCRIRGGGGGVEMFQICSILIFHSRNSVDIA